jgi:dTDP-4-amino-4,6-dideoxygalactose transaminase
VRGLTAEVEIPIATVTSVVESLGDLGCFSFQKGKSLCAGEGGAVIGHDDYTMARADAYTNNVRDPRGLKRTFTGSNFRITPFVAATLMGQMRR